MRPVFERLLAEAAEAILVVDPGRDAIRYANRGAATLLGIERDELLATSISSINRGQDGALRAFFAAVRERGYARTHVLSLRRVSGGSFPADVSGMRVRSASELVLVLVRDRSEHRHRPAAPRGDDPSPGDVRH